MIAHIGRGDPKSIFLNAAEEAEPDDCIVVIVVKRDGRYMRYNTELTLEKMLGIIEVFKTLITTRFL
jgi:hypothetical protein